MKTGSHSLSRLLMFVVGFLTLIVLGALTGGRQLRAWAQEPSPRSAGQDFFFHRQCPTRNPQWAGHSDRCGHAAPDFSDESSSETQYKLRDEPRFWIQHMLRHRPQAAFGMQPSDIFGTLPEVNAPKPKPNKDKKPKPEKIKGAWLQGLADTFFNIDTAHGIPYPAKYIFTNTASASCSDWVVFPGPQTEAAHSSTSSRSRNSILAAAGRRSNLPTTAVPAQATRSAHLRSFLWTARRLYTRKKGRACWTLYICLPPTRE